MEKADKKTQERGKKTPKTLWERKTEEEKED